MEDNWLAWLTLWAISMVGAFGLGGWWNMFIRHIEIRYTAAREIELAKLRTMVPQLGPRSGRNGDNERTFMDTFQPSGEFHAKSIEAEETELRRRQESEWEEDDGR